MHEDILNNVGRTIANLIIRALGILLLLIGLWVAIEILSAAQDLYENPEKIERFSIAIEKGSNIDKALAPQSVQVSTNGDGSNQTSSATNKDQLRLSYFCAWVIVLLLMLLIARISLTAIKTGGELALFDTQMKPFSPYLVKESNNKNNTN